MKKKLNPETLWVESFEASEAPAEGGGVLAYGISQWQPCASLPPGCYESTSG